MKTISLVKYMFLFVVCASGYVGALPQDRHLMLAKGDSEHSVQNLDATITAKVKAEFVREKLFGDKDTAVMSVHVETRDGVVYLTGCADRQEQIDTAVKLSKKVKGVSSVRSDLRLCDQ